MSTTVRLTPAEFDRMIERGVFDEGRRIELLHGELREMTPPGPTHEYVIDLLTRWSLDNAPRDEVLVRIQNSIGIPALDSTPMPDIAWVKNRSYRTGRPQPDDVLLVIEVADSSLRLDRWTKAGLYAGAGIADYWIVNIPESGIEVFRSPAGGTYQEHRTYDVSQSVTPLAVPDAELPVSLLF